MCIFHDCCLNIYVVRQVSTSLASSVFCLSIRIFKVEQFFVKLFNGVISYPNPFALICVTGQITVKVTFSKGFLDI